MGKGRRPVKRKPAADGDSKADDPQAVNSALVAALNHPTRRALLKLFLEQDAALSPKELAELTEERLPTISYHVRVLADKRTIELAEEEQVRGSVAHFYRASELTKSTPWVLASLDL
jgi:DNA-binding transcriptional ArsR family regulator